MNERQIRVGLDVGTTKVCTIVGIRNADSELEIIGVGSNPSHGLKKGSVVNIDKTINSIRNSLEEAKSMAGVEISDVTVGIAGNHIYSFNSTGVAAVKGTEVTVDDVQRVIEAAKAVVIPSDREIIHVIPQEFKVDNQSGIKNPVGMCGVRLEVQVHIVTGSISLIQNLMKCVEEAGVKPSHIMLQPIASSEAVLSKEEKELGVVLIDIGGGTTDIAVWKDGSLLHSQIIPVGGNHFTNDLAVSLKSTHAEAERIKVNHGSVLVESVNQSSHITVQGMPGSKIREIQLGQAATILGARAEEIFDLIKVIVGEKLSGHELPGGYIITGGGALINGMAELAEYIFESPVRIGYPKPFGGMTNIMQDPKFSTVLGLLVEADRYSEKHRDKINLAHRQKDLMSRLSQSMKNVFREIF